MISTRAHRSSDLLRKRALPGGYFTRALYRGGRNHVGPANMLSFDSRLQAPDLSLMHRTFSADRIAPKHPLRSRAANSSRRIGRGASPRRPLPRDKSAALETAFVMGERRDVWYNMRIENQMIASDNQIVVYQPNETVRLDVRLENEVQTNEPPLQSVFYQNKFWDAKSLLIKFIRRAKKELIVIDAYPGVATGKCCQCENVASHQFQFPIGEAA